MQASENKSLPESLSDPEIGFKPCSFPRSQRDKYFLNAASEGTTVQDERVVRMETSDGGNISQDMRATLWFDLEKNFQYAMAQTQTKAYLTPERLWKDLFPYIGDPHRRNPAALAVDRLTTASVELCRIMRSTATFIFGVYDISHDAIVLLDPMAKYSEEAWVANRNKLSERICKLLDFSSLLEEKLTKVIDDLKTLQTEMNNTQQFKGAEAYKQESASRLYLFLATFTSTIGMTIALGLAGERSAAASGVIGLSGVDTAIIAGLGLASGATSVLGARAKALMAKKGANSETHVTLNSTLHHTTDTLRTAEQYTDNFQSMRTELVEVEDMLYGGSGSLAGIRDRFKRLKFIFGELRNESALAQQFVLHYKVPAGCYTIEGLLGSSE
ncbi:hypothetical protein FRB95_012547 [Tulasnella sp. JGI-2019a]|nr:hypothetical protein FRB95_012547 [Tulasnella sp. JGI-2019a]